MAISGVVLVAGPAAGAEPFSLPCKGVSFAEVATPSGLDFRYQRGASDARHLPETMGSGLAWLDADGDGWLDLYLVQAGPFPPTGAVAATDSLFRNRGDGLFEDVSLRSGLDDRGYGMGAIPADLDGDGDLDLLVTQFGTARLLVNDGALRFEDRTAESGFELRGWSTSAAFADADGDGDLDLYVARYLEYDPEHAPFCVEHDSQERGYCHPSLFEGSPHAFFENLGGGRFRDATRAAGFGAAVGRGLGVLFVDLDDDRRPDLYVANDLHPNFVFRNLGPSAAGGVRFEDLSIASGAAVNRKGEPEAGMGVAAGDLDGDGRPELAVTNFDVETNTLYQNLGDMQFEDVAARSGFGPPSFNLLGFGLAFADLDLDGDLDAYAANGHLFEKPGRDSVTYAQPGLLYLGDGAGRLSSETCGTYGWGMGVGRGLAVADADNDGDIDLAISNSNGPVALLRNETTSPSTHSKPWLGVTLRSSGTNTQAIGARVRLRMSSDRNQSRWVQAGDSYLSASDRRLVFGWKEGETPAELEILWPSGRVTRIARPGASSYLVLTEPR